MHTLNNYGELFFLNFRVSDVTLHKVDGAPRNKFLRDLEKNEVFNISRQTSIVLCFFKIDIHFMAIEYPM